MGWCISQRRLELTARRPEDTQSTKYPNTKKERSLSLPKVKEDTERSRQVSEDRPNLSSERRQRTPRRSCSSSNAQKRKQNLTESLKDAKPSFSERKRMSKVWLCGEPVSVFIKTT